MKKIVRVITRLNIGGPAIHAILLNSELNKAGYRDILVCGNVSQSEGDMGYLAREKKVEPVLIPEMGRDISPIKDIGVLIKLYNIMRKERPDIVHTHTAKAGTLGRIAALCAGVPVKVHTFHGHIFDGYFSPLKAKLFLLIERTLALITDKVITVSDLIQAEIVGRLKVTGVSKSLVMPLGLELEKFVDCHKNKGRLRSRIGADDSTLLVGIVGRLVPIKNHKMFIDVCRAVRDEKIGLKVKFVIIGDGELRPYLEDLVSKSGLNDTVVFTGWIEDLTSVYADLDIVALTSLNEGTPVSIIEAMAAAKAVIATDVGGVRDLFDDGANGVLISNGDADGFRKELVALLMDAQRRRLLGENGRNFVVKKYSKDRLLKDMSSLYEELCSGKAVR